MSPAFTSIPAWTGSEPEGAGEEIKARYHGTYESGFDHAARGPR